VVTGCGDDDHKGTISTGSAAPTTSASGAGAPKTLLVYAPGTPIASMRVAEVFKRRLGRKKIGSAEVKVGGEVVHVHVPAEDVAKVERTLGGGRLELHVLDTEARAFGDTDPASYEPLVRREEVVTLKSGPKTVAFLSGSNDQRDALLARTVKDQGSALALVGPLYDAGKPAGFRSYLVDAERRVRGEMVASAKVESADGKASLALTFEGSGKSFLRWHSSQKERFVLRIDGNVIGTFSPDAPVTDGVLRVPFPSRGDDKTTVAAANKLAATLDGVALSHETVLKKK
jgi:hypothetical protein